MTYRDKFVGSQSTRSDMHLRYTIYLLLAAISGLVPATLRAQNISFSAEAAPQRLGIKDALQITYTLENADDIESLEPAPSKDFAVVGGPMDSRGSSISIVNGKRTQRTTFSRTYILQPKRTGNLRAPEGIARTSNGKSYRSNAPEIEVIKGSVAPQRATPRQDPLFSDPFFQSPFATPPPPPEPPVRKIWNPQPGRDLFIRASVNKSKAYVGEAVVVNYRLFSRVTVQAQLTKLPQASGAWTEEIPDSQPQPRDETVNGRPYRSVLIKSVLMYPQQAGTLTLPAAEVEGYAQPPGDELSGVGSFFSDPSFGAVPVRLRTDAVSLTVLPVPDAGKPADFNGAVGTLSLEASLDKTSTSTDANATLTLTLRGAGAGRLTPVPRPTFPDGIDAYEPTVHDSIMADGTGIKTLRYALSARGKGTYVIPATTLTYFDPQIGAYRSTSTQRLTLQVTAGGGSALALASSKEEQKSEWPEKLLLAFAMAGVAGFITYLLVKKKAAPIRPTQPAQPALQPIATVETASMVPPPSSSPRLESAKTHADLLRIFRQRLSELLEMPGVMMTKSSVLRALDSQGVPDDVLEKVHSVWQQCEAAVYAPGGLVAEQTLPETARDAAAALDQIRLRPAA